MGLRSLAALLVPPVFVSIARTGRRVIRREPPPWEYAPEGWEHSSGWADDRDVARVAERYRSKLPAFQAAIEGARPIGVPTSPARGVTPTVADQNIILEFGYALGLAGWSRDRVTVLDWGGGVGFLSFVAAELTPQLAIEYHVKELSGIAAAGRDLVPGVRFWDDETCLNERYDLILASNSLQYVEDWRSVLGRFGQSASGGYVLLQHVPVARHGSSFTVRQRAYGSAFTSWVFGRDDLLTAASSADLVLVREFLESLRGSVAGAPSDWESRGFLFRAADRSPGG